MKALLADDFSHHDDDDASSRKPEERPNSPKNERVLLNSPRKLATGKQQEMKKESGIC
jgi:hypothetical protein